jgi:uncharacterized membrane protein
MSDLQMMTVYAATYGNVDDAKADYEAVKSLYYDWGLMDSFDAAILMKKENGKVKIVKKHEQPTRQGAWLGGGLGLATGLVVALFPAAAVGAGVLAAAGAGGGAAIGALAGHAAYGMSRGDLKELGEALDVSQSGLLVIAATDVGNRVAEALKSADKVLQKQIKADEKEFQKELKELEKG